MRAGKQVGPRIELVEQMPQSPDTNTCDLGFFRSIDSRLPKLRSFKLHEFVSQITHEFDTYPPDKLDSIFDQKQRIAECIWEEWGDNTYKMPHSRDTV